MPVLGERFLQHGHHLGLIIDDQDIAARRTGRKEAASATIGRRIMSATGNVTTNLAPPPGRSSTKIAPPWALMMP